MLRACCGRGRTPYDEYKVELPLDFLQRDRRHLIPDGTDGPVSYSGGESVSFASDLHWHDFGHIGPGISLIHWLGRSG